MSTLPPGRPDGQPLQHALMHEARMLLAYYNELNGDCDRSGFPGALQRLCDDIGPLLRQSRLPLNELEERVQVEIGAFADRWRLPRRHGRGDLLATLRRASGGGPPRMAFMPRSYWNERIGTPVVYDGEGGGEPPILTREYLPLISPQAIEPILYDPRRWSRAELRRHAKALADAMVKDIMRQAAALEREVIEQGRLRQEEARRAAADGRQPEQHGWSPVPPRHSDPAELRRMARRLYRAAVMRRNNEAILGLEARDHARDEDYEPCTAQAVSKSVLDWARALDIPLPRR